MKPTRIMQRYMNGPEKSPCGDCYSTTIACLLGLEDQTSVPHFVDIAISRLGKGSCAEPMWVREWLRTYDLDMAGFEAQGLRDDWVSAYPDQPLYGSATIPGHTAKWHSVVWDVPNARVEWDPTTGSGYDFYDISKVVEIELITLPYDPAPESMMYTPWQFPQAVEAVIPFDPAGLFADAQNLAA